MDPNERVLCVPTAAFREVGYFQGFCPDVMKYLTSLIRADVCVFLPRGECEEDPSFKQIIPYMAFLHGCEQKSLLTYYRTKMSGEQRLRGRASIGIGGHINLHEDGASTSNSGHITQGEDELSCTGTLYEIVHAAWQRELNEEVIIKHKWSMMPAGVINDDTDRVGQVHLGIFLIIEVESQEIVPSDDTVEDFRFRPIQEVYRGHTAPRLHVNLDEFENWSKIVLSSDVFGT